MQLLSVREKLAQVLAESTRQRLASYAPSDALERMYLQRMLALLGERAPFQRDHFAPGHFTASAFVLSPERDAVLLIFHKKLQIWVQPGGHVEPADLDLASAARRELLEEVGIGVDSTAPAALFDVDVHVIPVRKAEPAHEHFDVRFWFVAPSRDFTTNDEVADARWFELADIERVISDPSVVRAVRKLG